MSLVTIKVSLNDENYINWKNRKNKKEQEKIAEPVVVQSQTKNKLPTLKHNEESILQESRKIFKPENMSEGMLMLFQPFGSAKVYSVIDQMYFDKYNDITEKKCNWCTLSFTHYPATIPYNVQKKNARIQQVHNAPTKTILKDDVFICKGCFCSFNCAMAQICESHDSDKSRQKELLYTLYRLSGGSNDDDIVASAPKELMIDYGGILTEEDYAALIGSNNKFQITHPYIVIPGSRISRVKIYTT